MTASHPCEISTAKNPTISSNSLQIFVLTPRLSWFHKKLPEWGAFEFLAKDHPGKNTVDTNLPGGGLSGGFANVVLLALFLPFLSFFSFPGFLVTSLSLSFSLSFSFWASASLLASSSSSAWSNKAWQKSNVCNFQALCSIMYVTLTRIP